MAEYTDNYNLSMPEQTDTQADFISAYRENMEIIDDNLGGGGNADVVHLTKAEYDALPNTKLSDNKIYLIEDAPSGGGGSSVTWNQIQATGEKIAEITINGTTTEVLIPFEAKIIVTTTTGLTVTATKGGTTYTATETSTGVYEVTVDSKGTWTVTDGTNTTTVSVTAQTTYNVAFVVIPDGSTVTPTDDIQTWLNCANIWDKNYTTLAEVLADSTTLSALISSNNAVDYLVRSTTWAGVQVPVMTSDNTPSGECFGSSYYNDSRYRYYRSFDGTISSTEGWNSSENSQTEYIGYDFTRDVVVTKVELACRNSSYPQRNVTLRGSHDKVTWDDISVLSSNITDTNTHTYTVSNSTAYRYYSIQSTAGNGNVVTFSYIQFYTDSLCDNSTAMTYIGLNNYCANKLLADATWRTAICNSTYFESVLNVKVPTMTDNTHPSGEAFASSVFNNASIWQPYHCFDNSGYDAGWYCASDVNQAGQYAGYMFTDVKKIYKARIVYTNKNNNSVYKLRGKVSADGSYQDITSNQTKTYPLTKQTDTFIFTSPAEYKYFILYIVSGATYTSGYTPGLTLFEIQFYGREDV